MKGMRELHLFAGAGGGILGGILLGHTCVCAVEIDWYCQKVLLQRQADGILPRFPIWDDIKTFDGKPWKGRVDIICGGFPCQDISVAGKHEGIEGEKSGLWKEMLRVCDEIRPSYIFMENSPCLISSGIGRIMSYLSKMGYDCRWGILGCSDIGGSHHRKRIWILAHSMRNRLSRGGPQTEKTKSSIKSFLLHNRSPRPGAQRSIPRAIDDMAHRMDRLKAIGNGQVPAVVKLAWETLSGQ